MVELGIILSAIAAITGVVTVIGNLPAYSLQMKKRKIKRAGWAWNPANMHHGEYYSHEKFDKKFVHVNDVIDHIEQTEVNHA